MPDLPAEEEKGDKDFLARFKENFKGENPQLPLTPGIVLIVVFLIVASLAPQISRKLGQLSQKKQGQLSLAKETAPAEGKYVKDELLIKFKDGVGDETKDSILKAHSLTREKEIPQIKVQVLRVDPGKLEKTLTALNQNPNIQYAEKDAIATVMVTTPNDPYFTQGKQWALPKIQAPKAWDITTGSPSVVVAALESGISFTHPDLAGKTVAGYDFVSNDNDPSDDNGNGTYVAGIIAAATNNSLGVAGVSWGSRIMPIRVCSFGILCRYSAIASGITYAADNGAKILNISLAGTEDSQALRDAIDYAYSKNALVVAAAGSLAGLGNPVTFPASLPHVLAVGATMQADDIWPHSSFGPYVDLSAPGFDIYSTYYFAENNPPTNGYAVGTGTSAAAAHVSGAAALIWSLAPFLTPDQVENILKTGAVDLGTPGRDDYFGWGRLDIFQALLKVTKDTDGDRFGDLLENFIGTDPYDACPDNSGDPAWPPDFDNNKVVNILDAGAMRPYVNSQIGDGKYNPRFDLNVDGKITTGDAEALKPYFNKTCT